MGDGLLCAGTRHGPALSSTESSLPSSRRWLEEASGFLPLIPKGPRRANPSKEQSNIPFVPEENAWDLVDETCAQGRAPAPAPGTGSGWGARSVSSFPWPWAADWLTSSVSGSGSL